ncbi:MAG: hypothetical protein FGF52_03015 [Candidatus Brockarchaeota archaeon]|nr:hypothetical protein [Candidatus Brockarchaeota archaeon]
MQLLQILEALFKAPRWKAKYVGGLPAGIKEVIRETFECFSITFSSELDAERMKKICLEQGFLVKEKDSKKENIYDQFGMLIETRVIEWTYPFRIIDSDGEIVLFADPEDQNKIYVIPLIAVRHTIQLRKDVIDVIEKYRVEKYGR